MKNSVYPLVFIFLVTLPFSVFSQVGINTDTPNLRAVLDLNSPTHDQGLLVPRLSTSQRTAQAFMSRLSASENGLLIFDIDDKLFYYWMFPGWVAVDAGVAGTAWRSGTDKPENSIGVEGDYYLNVVDGSVYHKDGGAYVLALNIKGDAGPAGPAGPQGLKGDQGNPGPIGLTGPQGLKGDQGDPGPIGPAGPQGLKGDQGDPGPIGLTGPQGLKGDQGDPGPIGPAGPQGLQGVQGDPGPIGLTGPQGLKGDQGDPGPIGPAGPQGLKGDQGDPGPIGLTGAQGLKGDQGDPGPIGPTGPQGLKGDQGDQGPIGLTGPQGLKGDQGDPGPIGLTGPQGLKGDQGDPGPIGPAGPQGLKGDQGDPGPIGLTGPQGPPGDPGVFKAITITSSYTATADDDVIIATQGGTTITLPPAALVPGKVYHIRHRLLLGSVTIRAPAGNSIIDANAAQTFTIGLLAPTAISIISVNNDSWYIIGKF